jgi:cyclopropane fatty-acyl-phospholipid synthase-like methyltransferase
MSDTALIGSVMPGAANLRANEARAVAGERTVRTYMRYPTGCAGLFRGGECNVYQFKLRVI